jgi:hypothetical protein
VNEKNSQYLIGELLNYLNNIENELKDELSNQICKIAEKYSPSNQYKLTTLLKVPLKLKY